MPCAAAAATVSPRPSTRSSSCGATTSHGPGPSAAVSLPGSRNEPSVSRVTTRTSSASMGRKHGLVSVQEHGTNAEVHVALVATAAAHQVGDPEQLAADRLGAVLGAAHRLLAARARQRLGAQLDQRGRLHLDGVVGRAALLDGGELVASVGELFPEPLQLALDRAETLGSL